MYTQTIKTCIFEGEPYKAGATNWHKKTFERYFEEQNRAEWLSRLTIGIIRDIILDTTAYCFGCAMTYWRGLNKED